MLIACPDQVQREDLRFERLLWQDQRILCIDAGDINERVLELLPMLSLKLLGPTTCRRPSPCATRDVILQSPSSHRH